MAKTIFLIALLVIAGALPLGAQAQQQQSLGDIARQLRKQQNNNHNKATKVITNDNLPEPKPGEAVSSLPIAPLAPETPATTDATAAKPAPAATENAPGHEVKTSDDKARTREYWQAKFKAARQDLAKAKQQQQLSEDELNLLQIQQIREIDPAAKADLTAKVQAKQSEVDVNTAATQASQKALDDLTQEFKDSGAPEEWSNTEEPSAPPAS